MSHHPCCLCNILLPLPCRFSDKSGGIGGVAWLCAGVVVLCIHSSTRSSHHHLSLSHCNWNGHFNRNIPSYFPASPHRLSEVDGAGHLGCIFSLCASLHVHFLFYQLPLGSLWIPSDEIVLGFGAYSLSFVLVISSCCPHHSQFLRYFAYSYHCKEKFLPSVPCCCSVITDILKKLRKKITGEGKDFSWGISAGYSSFWGWKDLAAGGKVISQECQGGLCLGWLWDLPKHSRGFHGSALAVSVGQSSPCSCCCWKAAGAEGAISRQNGAGIWSGLHRQASLVQRHRSLPLLPLGVSPGKCGSCVGH